MINKIIRRIEKVTLNCGEWRISFDKFDLSKLSFWHISKLSFWHICGTARSDMNVTVASLKDLQMLINEALKELESTE